MRTPALGGLAVLLVAAAASTAAIADDRAHTPLERGAFVATPAVYDLISDQRIDALIVDKRRVPVGRNVPIRGTAFGVAPGRVVAAQHVAAPSRQQLIEEIVAVAGLSGVTTDPARVRVVARTPRTVSLMPATAAVSGASPHPIAAQVKRRSSEVNDLVLLKIADLDAPTLALNDALTRGTPAAVIGFGAQPPAIAAVRLGTLDGPRLIKDTNNDGFGGFEGAVLGGDSGAPVVDAHGQAHGVVLRLRSDTAPVIARAESVRALLEADGVSGGESAATAEFRTAMAAFWRRDYGPAAASLKRLRDADPAGAFVRHEYERATALVAADYTLRRPSRTRGAVLAFGAMAAVCAAALGALRIRRQPFLP